MTKSIYIAGPMSGYPFFNFPTFFAKQKELEAQGWTVWNPANKDSEGEVQLSKAFETGDDKILISEGWDFKDAYLWDITKIIEGNAIYMLPGWEASAGARGEHAVAVSMKARYPEYEIIYG